MENNENLLIKAFVLKCTAHVKYEYYLKKALKIKDKSLTYINEEKAWNETIYDILSLSCFYNKKYKESLRYIKKALKLNNQDERLNQNYLYIKKYAI